MNSIAANPATETNTPPRSCPMPSSTIEASNNRTGATRSFSLGHHHAERAADQARRTPDSTSDSVSESPAGHEVLRVEAETNSPKPQNW